MFTQITPFMPPKIFRCCVERYLCNFSAKSFTLTDQFRMVAFARLSYRGHLRDIDVCHPSTEQRTLS
ncbi:MAG: DUF4372 domain-containing protein [Syntrophobacterales bacterium]|nr:DUF4372 domain-containing protein [Syntrophobacterales bacterium]